MAEPMMNIYTKWVKVQRKSEEVRILAGDVPESEPRRPPTSLYLLGRLYH